MISSSDLAGGGVAILFDDFSISAIRSFFDRVGAVSSAGGGGAGCCCCAAATGAGAAGGVVAVVVGAAGVGAGVVAAGALGVLVLLNPKYHAAPIATMTSTTISPMMNLFSAMLVNSPAANPSVVVEGGATCGGASGRTNRGTTSTLSDIVFVLASILMRSHENQSAVYMATLQVGRAPRDDGPARPRSGMETAGATTALVKTVGERLKYANKVATAATRYLGIIADIVRGSNPAEYNALTNAIKVASTCELTYADAVRASTETTLSNIYDRIAEIDAALGRLSTMFSNAQWSRAATYNKSSTYTVDIHRLRSDAATAHEQYLDADDDAIFTGARALIGEPPIAFVLENENTINKFTIWLFGWALSTARGQARTRIELIVERCKDNILGSAMVPAPGVLTRLLPATESMDAAKLWKLLGRDDASAPGLIVINNATGSPMEFSLAGMIDAEFIERNNFKTAPTSGLTNQVLKRFVTVRRLESSAPDGSSDADKSSVGKSSVGKSSPLIPPPGRHGAAPYHVIETIDGHHWRVLTSTGADALTPTDDSDVDRASTRPWRYTDLQSITSACFDERTVHILRDYAAMTPPSTEILRARIVERLVRGFEERLRDYVGSTRTTDRATTLNPRVFRSIAIDIDDITSVLLDTLSEYAGDASPEAICTYAAKTDTVIRSLTAEINRALDAREPPARFYSETAPTELTASIIAAYRGALARAVDELERSHTWNEYNATLKDLI